MPTIGTLQESSLHSAIKEWIARPGDQAEVQLDGFWIDLHCGDHLVEIQTRNFFAIKPKLKRLLQSYPVTLVYPVAREKWIIRLEDDLQTRISRRKSPRMGREEDVFYEIIRIPDLLPHRNLTIKILMTTQEEILCRTDAVPPDGRRTSWRRKGWKIYDRRLIQVTGEKDLCQPADLLGFLPATLPEKFFLQDLTTQAKISRPLAQRMAYSLRKLGLIEVVDRKKQGYIYRIKTDSIPAG
jgi:hypothetical protein